MLVDLDSGKVLHNVGDESTILPRRSVRKLMSDWEVTVNITQQAETARNALYSESFLRMFVDLCGHYEQNIHCSDSGHKYFEVNIFAVTVLGFSVNQKFIVFLFSLVLFSLASRVYSQSFQLECPRFLGVVHRNGHVQFIYRVAVEARCRANAVRAQNFGTFDANRTAQHATDFAQL